MVTGFHSRFGVENINLASPDYHLSKLDFVFYFELWYDGHSANVAIGESENHPDTLLISEGPNIVIMAITNELSPHHILNFLFQRIHFSVYG